MKNCQFLFFLSVLLYALFVADGTVLAQNGHFKCTFTIKDKEGKAMSNVEMDLIDTDTKKKFTQKTDASGKAEILLESGKIWQIAVLKIRDFWSWQFDLPKISAGKTGEYSRTFTYNYEGYRRETRPAVDRTKLDLKVVNQNFNASQSPTATEGIISLSVMKADRSPLTNFPVRITSYALHTIFEAKTNAGGTATFKVPINNEYQIDIDGIENFHYVDLPNAGNARSRASITYEPTNVQETNVKDTVTQALAKPLKGTTGRVAITLTVRKATGGNWENEPVFLETLKEKTVYKGKTNQSGIVDFLLPKGKKYMIHGNYEKNIDVIDLTRTRGIAYSNKNVVYRPIDRYQNPQNYFPKPEDLAFREFVDFINKQFKRPAAGDALLAYARWGNAVNADSKQALLELAFVSEKEELVTRKPINLSLVVDRSGSMAGEDRIDKVKKALLHFADALHENDFISLVIFDDDRNILLPAKKMGIDKSELKQEITYIEAGGGTNISLGLEEGYKEVMKNYKKKITNRVVLLTDGYGDDDPLKTIKLAKDYQKKGIDCSVVGVGEFYNFGLLRSIANLGGGLIEFVKDKDDFLNIFSKELGAAVFPVAENVKVEVTYNKNLLFAQLLGAPLEEKHDGKVSMKLRNVYSGLDQLAMIKFTLVNPSQSIEKEPVTIKMKYFDLQKEQMVEKTTVTYLTWSQANGKLEFILDNQTKYYYSVALMNQTLKVMSESFAKGDRNGAKNAIIASIKEVKEIFPTVSDEDIKTLLAELEKYEEILINLK